MRRPNARKTKLGPLFYKKFPRPQDLTAKNIACYLSSTSQVNESDRRKYKVSNQEIEEAGEIIDLASTLDDELARYICTSALDTWRESENKAKVAREIYLTAIYFTHA